MSIENPNSTDATMGQSLRSRVEARRAELRASLHTPSTARIRTDLQIALEEVDGLMTGDLDHIPQVVAAQLSTWLEVNKHLVEYHSAAEANADQRLADAATD